MNLGLQKGLIRDFKVKINNLKSVDRPADTHEESEMTLNDRWDNQVRRCARHQGCWTEFKFRDPHRGKR